jgi:hypothetical protein
MRKSNESGLITVGQDLFQALVDVAEAAQHHFEVKDDFFPKEKALRTALKQLHQVKVMLKKARR